MSEQTKERLFEITMIVTSLIGLLVLFTILFAGPRFIFNRVLEYLNFI